MYAVGSTSERKSPNKTGNVAIFEDRTSDEALDDDGCSCVGAASALPPLRLRNLEGVESNFTELEASSWLVAASCFVSVERRSANRTPSLEMKRMEESKSSNCIDAVPKT